jgi:hypothetical protein
LGFSYNQFNVARLKLGRSKLDLATTIIGTTRGLKGLEIDDAKGRLAEALGGDINLSPEIGFADNLDIFKEHMFLG